MKKEALQALLNEHAKIDGDKIVFDLENIHTKVNVFGTDMRKKGEELGEAKGATELIASLELESVKDVAGLKGYITELGTNKTDSEVKLAGLRTEFDTYKTGIDTTLSNLKSEGITAKRDSLKVINKFDPKYTDLADFKVDSLIKADESLSFDDAYAKVKDEYPEWVTPEIKDKGGATPPTGKLTEDEEAEFAKLAGL